MAIITRSELRNIAVQKLTINESIGSEVQKARNDSRHGKEVTIFLSHCHDDKHDVFETIVFLRKLSIRVYVDWMDNEMPAITSGVTASRIKEKIDENRKFILLATNSAIRSKWCNWELGLV